MYSQKMRFQTNIISFDCFVIDKSTNRLENVKEEFRKFNYVLSLMFIFSIKLTFHLKYSTQLNSTQLNSINENLKN
jgi:hemolysin activation/secretion protein